MPEPIEIIVYGTPGPQGSKSFKGIRGGKAILAESSAKVKPWREAVKFAALAAGKPHVAGPVVVMLTFTLPKPKSAPKRRQTFPDRKPDIDKLCRSTLDALVQVGTIEDDARVITLVARKVYPREWPDALDSPGCKIGVIEAAGRMGAA